MVSGIDLLNEPSKTGLDVLKSEEIQAKSGLELLEGPTIETKTTIIDYTTPVENPKSFDPEGTGYDMESALKHGLKPDETGHWPSRVPDTGLLLKGRGHETWPLTLKGEEEAGYEIFNKDGRYYSSKKSQNASKFYGKSAISPPFQGLAPMVITPEISAYLGSHGGGPRPEGGWDEMMRPLDKTGKPYGEDTEAKVGPIRNAIADTVKGLSAMATHPLEVVRGGIDFFMTIPGFLTGVISATSFGSKEILDQVVLGGELDLDKVYDKASEGMQKSMEFFQPAKELIAGQPTPESNLTTQVAMAPLSAFSMVGQKVASWDGFKNYPNIRGAAKFAGDIAGMVAMGMLIHGSEGKANFTKKVEDVVAKADKIIEKEQAIGQIPEELIKQTQQKVVDMEKVQVELRAKEIVAGLKGDIQIREEMGRQADDLARAKVYPIEDSGLKAPTKGEIARTFRKTEEELADPEATFTSKKGNEYVKKDGVWYKDGVEVTNSFVIKAAEKGMEETVTEVDVQTGTPKPESLQGEQSPFFQNAEETEVLKNLYAERPKVVESDPELMTQKLINDVNRWYNGDENVDIDGVRGALSQLATRADDLLRMLNPDGEPYFITGVDHLQWKDVVTEAADWARGLDRSKIERTGGTKLYSGISPKDIKRAFKGWHGTSSKYIKPEDMVGKYLKPKSLKEIVEDTLNELKLTGTERDKARQKIYDYDYFEYSIKGGEYSRPFDEGGEVFIAKDFELASDYANWAGEAYDNALIALGAFDKEPNLIAKKAKEIYDKNREADPYVLEVETDRKLKEGDNVSLNPIKVTGVYDTKGTKLYSGIPLDEAKDTIIKGARKIADYTKSARGMKAFKPMDAAKLLKTEFTRNFVDRSGNIRKDLLDKLGDEGYEVIQKMYLSKGASSLAANMLKQMRKEVYGGLSRAEKKILDDLIFASRMVDIASYKSTKQFKFPQGLTPADFVRYKAMFQFKNVNGLSELTATKAAELSKRSEGYFEWMKKPLKDMFDAELISEEEFNNLSKHNYRRIKLVDIFDKRYGSKVGKTKRTIYDSGVESLAKGRTTDIYEPSSEVMALEVFNRAYGRILNQAANKTLLDLATKDTENPFVRVKQKKGDLIPSGWSRLFVYDKGERKTMWISPEMSKEWITNSPEMSYRLSQFLRYASGSPVLRTFATGINWGFALANLPRDVMHAWFAARAFEDGKMKPIYNPILPVYGLQMGRDLATVFSDSVLRKGRYEDYIKEGGGMEFLVHQGRILQRGRHLEGPMDAIFNFMGYFGETSEIMTRLAIREGMLRKGKSSTEATFAARDYMDFGQGGGISKALDNAFPYLNAAIQGTRGMMRAIKDNPAESAFKLSQLAALTTGLYVAMQKRTPKTAAALKYDVQMQNNICIPLGDDFGFEDEEGQMRYPYLKIPLDQSQRFFKKFFEASADKWLGNDVDVDGTVNALENLSPVGVSSLPPTASGVIGYMANKNFWRNEDIWKQTSKPFSYPESSKEIIPGRTPQGFIDFGAKTGLSPERTKYAVEQLVTHGTVWSYLLGEGYDVAFGDLPKSNKEQHLAEVLAHTPVVKRFFGVTSPASEFVNKINKIEEKDVISTFVQRSGLDARIKGYLIDKNVSRSEIIDYMKSFKDKDVYDRLKDRFEFQLKSKDLPHKYFWNRLQGLSSKARAEAYVDRLETSTDSEKVELRKELAKVIQIGGVVTPEFREEVMKLRSK